MKIHITYYEGDDGKLYAPIRYDFLGIKLKVISPEPEITIYYITYEVLEERLQSKTWTQETYVYDARYYNDMNTGDDIQFLQSKVLYAGSFWVISVYEGFDSQCFEMQNITHPEMQPVRIYEFKLLKLYEEGKILFVKDLAEYLPPSTKFIWNRILWKISEEGALKNMIYFEGIKAIDDSVTIRYATGSMSINEFKQKVDIGEITFPSDQVFKTKEI